MLSVIRLTTAKPKNAIVYMQLKFTFKHCQSQIFTQSGVLHSIRSRTRCHPHNDSTIPHKNIIWTLRLQYVIMLHDLLSGHGLIAKAFTRSVHGKCRNLAVRYFGYRPRYARGDRCPSFRCSRYRGLRDGMDQKEILNLEGGLRAPPVIHRTV
jgi:hypothetical protein